MTLDLACEVGLERVGRGQVHFCFPTEEPRAERAHARGLVLQTRIPLPHVAHTQGRLQPRASLRSLPIHPLLSPRLGPLSLQHNPSLRAPTQPGRHGRSNSSQWAAHHLRPTASESWTLTQAPHTHTHTRKLITTQVPAHTPAYSPMRPVLGGRIHPQPLLSSDGQRKGPPAVPLPQAPRGGQHKAVGPPTSPAPHTHHHSLAAGLTQDVLHVPHPV